ncbi:PREDICTED: uncharacterized protein LOC107341911 [Acropora digitifera]|uniref:uncharacterized protein LOC107341911 n=1 Tax=Acropora digitifera TaxID=70779 RepID=UPI00077A928F|nr:PREDICTED: uncharacterized protein LOC107341911 [Acropora digitifera]
MKGEVRSLKLKATLLKNKMAKNQEQWVTTFQAIQHVEDTIIPPVHIDTSAQLDINQDQGKNLAEDYEDNEEDGDHHQMETKVPVFDEDPTWTPEEVDEAYVKLGDDCDDKKDTVSGLRFEGKDERDEPKGIVFLSKLLLLFQYCQLYMAPSPAQTGTLLTIETKCSACKGIFKMEKPAFLTWEISCWESPSKLCSPVCRCFHKESFNGFPAHGSSGLQ